MIGLSLLQQASIGSGQTHAFEPRLKFGRASKPECIAQIERVMKGRALIIQHDIVGPGHPHDEIDTRHAEQGQERIHVVLIGFCMVGVTDIAAHGHAEQFAAEMVFKPGAGDLFAIVQVFRTDKSHHRIGQERCIAPGHGIRARLAGLLVYAMMRIRRECASLAGLEVHCILSYGPAS